MQTSYPALNYVDENYYLTLFKYNYKYKPSIQTKFFEIFLGSWSTAVLGRVIELKFYSAINGNTSPYDYETLLFCI